MKKALKILCPYCKAVWTGKMKEDLEASSGCETCGNGGSVSGTIDIHCDNCKKLIYRKEIDTY